MIEVGISPFGLQQALQLVGLHFRYTVPYPDTIDTKLYTLHYACCFVLLNQYWGFGPGVCSQESQASTYARLIIDDVPPHPVLRQPGGGRILTLHLNYVAFSPVPSSSSSNRLTTTPLTTMGKRERRKRRGKEEEL